MVGETRKRLSERRRGWAAREDHVPIVQKETAKLKGADLEDRSVKRTVRLANQRAVRDAVGKRNFLGARERETSTCALRVETRGDKKEEKEWLNAIPLDPQTGARSPSSGQSLLEALVSSLQLAEKQKRNSSMNSIQLENEPRQHGSPSEPHA
jgi:hypothetical protein